MRKRLVSVALVLCLALGLLPMSVLAAEPFSDVSPDAWYYSAVQYAHTNGFMNGTGKGTFSPNGKTTRGMIVTILYRLENTPSVSTACPFTDVEAGSYYEKAITWAATNQIVSGTSATTFAPDSNITREQMATILYRYAAYKQYDTDDLVSLTGYSDAAQISSWAEPAVKWAVGSQIISGVSATELSPAGTATRAQVATILMRFNKNAEAYLAFKEKDVDDFKGDEIINFDKSKETNFAVLKDDTVSTESSAGKNHLVSKDEENGIYVFNNIDKEISELQNGDVFYHVYGTKPDDYILLKVGSITIDDSTATITEGKAELSDFFKYIDIDMEVPLSESSGDVAAMYSPVSEIEVAPDIPVYASSGMITDAVDLPAVTSSVMKAKEGSASQTLKTEYNGGSFGYSAEAKVTLSIKIQYDQTIFDINEIKASVKTETTFEASVKKKITGDALSYRKDTPKIPVPIATGINAEFNAYFICEFKADVQGKLTATITSENGTIWSGGKTQQIKETNAELSATLGGAFSGKAGLGVDATVRVLKVLTLTLEGEGGIEISGGTGDSIGISTDKEVKHLCAVCIDGDLSAYFKLSVLCEIGISDDYSWTIFEITPASAKLKLREFYISFANDRSEVEFGWGKCPHKQYLVTVNVKDQNNTPITGALVEITAKGTNQVPAAGNVNGSGQFTAYCDNGSYVVTAVEQGGSGLRAEPVEFTVTGKASILNLTIKKAEEPAPEKTEQTTTPAASGDSAKAGRVLPVAGDNAYIEYDSSGKPFRRVYSGYWGNPYAFLVSEFTYNSQGMLTQIKTYRGTEDQFGDWWDYTYIGYEIATLTYDKAGKLVQCETHDYYLDDGGTGKYIQGQNTDLSTISYDKSGTTMIINGTIPAYAINYSDIKTVLWYNDGYCEKRVDYDGHGNILTEDFSPENDEYEQIRQYHYNASGQLISDTYTSVSKWTSEEMHHEYVYNKDGSLSKIKEQSATSMGSSLGYSSYTYNKNGNLTDIHWTENGETALTHHIEYGKDGHISIYPKIPKE